METDRSQPLYKVWCAQPRSLLLHQRLVETETLNSSFDLITKGYILVKLIALARYRNILGTLYSSFVSELVGPED